MAAMIIPARFNGPPTSGNGGYCAGLLAAAWSERADGDRGGRTDPGTVAEITLRAPIPLDTPLDLRTGADGAVCLHEGERLLAEARGARLDLEVPPSPGLSAAAAAGAIGRWRSAQSIGNAYLRCFGCGVSREAHDGLRLAPSPIEGSERVATDWTPDPGIAGPDGHTVSDPIVWAALDCPAGIAWNYRLADGPPLVTGRMTVAIDAPIRVGEPHVVIGWPILAEGRKLHAGTAIFDAQGRVLARSRQLWLIPKT